MKFKGCKFDRIVNSIGHSPTTLSDNDLTQLMRLLGTETKTRLPVKCRAKRIAEPSIPDCLEDILIEWRGRVSTEAKLQTFIGILREMKQNAIADELENEFRPNISSGTQSSASTSSTPTVLVMNESKPSAKSSCSIIERQSPRINICGSGNASTSYDLDQPEIEQEFSLNNKQKKKFISEK